MRKILLTSGDSWTFGSEIIDPKFLAEPMKPLVFPRYKNPTITDVSTENDSYREDKIWPYYLSKSLGYDLINIARPAVSNDWICSSTISWLMNNTPIYSDAQLVVVVGWTALNRKEFIISNNNDLEEKTFTPDILHDEKHWTEIDEFLKWYILVIKNEYYDLINYVNNVFNLALYCQKYNIDIYFFNALPEEINLSQTDKFSRDIKVVNYLEGFRKVKGMWGRSIYDDIKAKWDFIEERRFIMKDKNLNSFANYIVQLPVEERYNGIHPTPKAHEIWANYLHQYIMVHKDTYMNDLNSSLVKRRML